LANLILRNCRFLTSSGTHQGSIIIENGKIAALRKAEHVTADKVVDCRQKIVIPGAIDAHVHIHSPGWLEEDFRSGTRAAAAGGVTTVFDMPSVAPQATNNGSSFQDKRKVAEKDAIVNFALYGGEIQTENDVAQIGALVAAGAVGFKFILGGAGFIKDDSVLYAGFEEIKRANSIGVVHAENDSLVRLFRSRFEARRNGPVAFLDARPQVIEDEALQKSILFARTVGCRLHVAHLASRHGVEFVANAKHRGMPVTAETCPHYLLLSRRDYGKYGHRIIVTPPIRELADQKSLWAGLKKHVIDILATDHCAYSKRVKDAGEVFVWKTPGGLSGLETLLPLMLTFGVNKGRLTLSRLTELIAEAPARIFGFHQRKGVIRVGADADLVVLDLKRRYRLDANTMESVADFTPFDGWKMKGKPVMTIVNGHIVMEEGEIFVENRGRFVSPMNHGLSSRAES
jgi:allantoinase